MKRPSLKRKKKDKKPSPQQLVAASPFDRLPQKQRRLGKKKKPKDAAAAQQQTAAPAAAKKPRRLRKTKKPPTPQEQAAARATPAPTKKKGRLRPALGAPARLVRKPLAKLGGLKGRSRIVAWGALAIVVVVVGLQLRGGRDDDMLVRQALERYETASSRKDYQMLCDDLLAKSYVKQTASSGLPCEVALRTALEDVRNPTLDVLSVEVNGDRAAARVRGSAAGQVPGEAVYTLVREDDAWHILPPRPASTPAAP
ncbi:MAG TPA: nuclear transport factor 2 family protein [Solirubrobacteraceae bacterium]|jgi:hypothetical protein|nr:nuclear transport factor 2 family protein [Solirubrobacteraceae bacterium]